MKTCKGCGVEFVALVGQRRYCSSVCQNDTEYLMRHGRTVPKVRECTQCGKAFKPLSVPGGGPKVCSHECFLERDRAQNHAYYLKRRYGIQRPAQAQPVRPTGRDCNSCTHWTAKGCALEAFRTCNPGTASRHWQRKQVAA